MRLSVNEIAGIIQAKIIGDPELIINGISSFEDSDSNEITFAYNTKYLRDLYQTKALAIIIPDTFIFDKDHYKDITLLKTQNPKACFLKIVSMFHPEKIIKSCIHPSADIGCNVKFGKDPVIDSNVFIGDDVQIGNNVHLMPGVYIGNNVFIGDKTIIKPNVTIMEKAIIGKNVIIHSGTVIGSDGFGFTQSLENHEKIIHTGYVYIGNNVEIGAGNTIDRGTFGRTMIGNNVKTDNLVHIAHNVKIGDNTLIVAQVGIAGSSKIGKNVIIAGQAGISGHIKIGNGSIVGPRAGVHSNVPEKKIVSGTPHMPHDRWKKVVTIISRLPEMRKKIFSFEKRLKNLENTNK